MYGLARFDRQMVRLDCVFLRDPLKLPENGRNVGAGVAWCALPSGFAKWICQVDWKGFDEMNDLYRVVAVVGTLVVGTSVLTGCLGPTYGTDKSSSEQLLTDVGDALAIVPAKKVEVIAYQPRPGLIRPGAGGALAQPQQTLASKDNPAWVESPEETRTRLRDEAEANKANSSYRSPLSVTVTEGKGLSPEQQRIAYRDARKIQNGTESDKRRFLSDPPLDYRKVEDPAVLSNLGESEAAKERRRKKDAAIAGTGQKWWQLFN